MREFAWDLVRRSHYLRAFAANHTIRTKEITMSNTNSLSTTTASLCSIESSELAAVQGGAVTETRGRIRARGVEGEVSQTTNDNYETCLANNRRQAAEAHPDNRWFWQRWMGQDDPNREARIRYEREGAGQCTQR